MNDVKFHLELFVLDPVLTLVMEVKLHNVKVTPIKRNSLFLVTAKHDLHLTVMRLECSVEVL